MYVLFFQSESTKKNEISYDTIFIVFPNYVYHVVKDVVDGEFEGKKFKPFFPLGTYI